MRRESENERDLELVHKARNGDYTAFEELVRRYQPRIFSHCYRMLKNYQDAQDCLQETFLKAYEKLDTFREESSFSVWLYKVATNNCLMRIRKNQSHPEEIHIEDILPRHRHDDLSFEVPDWGADPEKIAINGELRALMDSSVLKLPEDYRAAFLLRDVEGFSTKDTAHILGLTDANVKSRLHRARLALRKQIAPYFSPAAGKEEGK